MKFIDFIKRKKSSFDHRPHVVNDVDRKKAIEDIEKAFAITPGQTKPIPRGGAKTVEMDGTDIDGPKKFKAKVSR